MATKTRRKKMKPEMVPGPNDLAVIPDGDGFILGMFNAPLEVTYGDVTREVEPASCYALRYECVKPEAGRFIGQKFGSLAEVNKALWPLRTGVPNEPREAVSV